MNDSQRRLLSVLKQNTNPTTATGLPSYRLAELAGQPEPSMRRNVQALRLSGYDIRVTPWKGYILHNQGTTITTSPSTRRGF